MRADKILIIDDKSKTEKYSSENAIDQLNDYQRSLVDHYRNATGFWMQQDDDVLLNKDFSCYRYIFIHDSYDEPIIQGGLKEVLIQKLSVTSTVVLFSGTKKESITGQKVFADDIEEVFWYELRRSQYFDGLSRFIESLVVFGDYKIEYLYNRYSDPKKDRGQELANEVRSHLEVSSQEAAHSNALVQLLQLFGYQDNESILERFSKLSDERFLSALDRLLQK